LNIAPIVKLVRAYDATEWEIFIGEWQKGLAGYAEIKRLGGPGDMGRDVIGLCSAEACEGIWDNYQCKHYETALSTPKACEDAGKIIFHAFNKAFRPPRRYRFVAPRGPETELRELLLNPSRFREEVVATWDKRVAKRVVAGETHLLAGELKTFVLDYDFTSFGYSTLDEILDAHRRTAYWASRFGGLLAPAPKGNVPVQVHLKELGYVGKLLRVYAEEEGVEIASVAALNAHPDWNADLQKQRVRFYDAEAFVAHYRDQTDPGTVEDFAEQILDAIEPALSEDATSRERLAAALSAAASSSPANVLAPQAKVRVKQGVCHQLANDDRVNWTLAK
jgi:hypothetical protein